MFKVFFVVNMQKHIFSCLGQGRRVQGREGQDKAGQCRTGRGRLGQVGAGHEHGRRRRSRAGARQGKALPGIQIQNPVDSLKSTWATWCTRDFRNPSNPHFSREGLRHSKAGPGDDALYDQSPY